MWLPKIISSLYIMRNYLIWIILILIVILLCLSYNRYNENFQSTPNYQWVTQGTCRSNNLQTLSQNECSNYFNNTNYNVTGSSHGPPGCWLVLGNELNKVLNDQPEFQGKGFACWSKVNDGKQCSSELPCVCK